MKTLLVSLFVITGFIGTMSYGFWQNSWLPLTGFLVGLTPGIGYWIAGTYRWGWRWMDDE